jgi:hypothetical protein
MVIDIPILINVCIRAHLFRKFGTKEEGSDVEVTPLMLHHNLLPYQQQFFCSIVIPGLEFQEVDTAGEIPI